MAAKKVLITSPPKKAKPAPKQVQKRAPRQPPPAAKQPQPDPPKPAPLASKRPPKEGEIIFSGPVRVFVTSRSLTGTHALMRSKQGRANHCDEFFINAKFLDYVPEPGDEYEITIKRGRGAIDVAVADYINEENAKDEESA